MAFINRFSKRIFELRVVRLEISWMADYADKFLHHLAKDFRSGGFFTDEVACQFSPDSQYIAVSASFGKLIVVKTVGKSLTLHCDVINGLLHGSEESLDVRLSNERCVHFDPRTLHRNVALGCEGEGQAIVYICDIDNNVIEGKIKISTEDEDNFVPIDNVKYSPRGRELVIACSDTSIRLYQPDLCELLYILHGNDCGAGISMVTNVNGYYPEYVHMSFSQMGDMMAVTSRDGYVRVWTLEPDISLLHLSRMKILQHTSQRDLITLPLPEKLILFLLQWAT